MNDLCFIVSDLHGSISRYKKLFGEIERKQPALVLIGGDLLPGGFNISVEMDFCEDFIVPELKRLKKKMNEKYPQIALILGNDDPRTEEQMILKIEEMGLWKYIHNKNIPFGEYLIFGYSYVPPTPFLLKDWERYDVSRFVDPGCVPPTEGFRSVKIKKDDAEFSTIAKDLEQLTKDRDMEKSIFVFHSPPYKTKLDRAALDNQSIDHIPLDVHVGSIAIHRFIEEKQPYFTTHGHIHESTRLTGEWQDKIGKTPMFNASTDLLELSIISLNLGDLNSVNRIIL